MTYEEIVDKVKKEFSSADVSKVEGHLALQVNITGEGEGAFYAEIIDGNLYIEPYEYYDRDAVLITEADNLFDIITGKLEPSSAVEAGKLRIEGSTVKAFELQKIIDAKKSVKKPAAKTAKASKKKTAEKSEPSIKLDDQLSIPVEKEAAKTTRASAKAAVKTESKSAAKTVKESTVKAGTKAAKTGVKKG